MGDNNQSSRAVVSHSMPALLLLAVRLVECGQHERIEKNAGRLIERDRMLLLVCLRLDGILFEVEYRFRSHAMPTPTSAYST